MADVGSSPGWLDRYRHGERGQVWHELRQLGRGVREPGVLEEAQLVCDEMACRARRNIEVFIGRLSAEGYRFRDNDDAQAPAKPHFPPAATAGGQATWLEEHLGPVPLTISSWVRLVGDIWLVGTHPQWEFTCVRGPAGDRTGWLAVPGRVDP